MKSILVAVAVAVLLAISAPAALAKHAEMPSQGATEHQVIGSDPGTVQVATQYDRAIKLVKLDKNHVGYWSLEGAKYITAGDYAYVWCKVYNTKDGTSHYGWVAVNTESLNKALGLANTTSGGVAFYKLFSQGKTIVMEAIPYDTSHAMAQGQPVVDVKE